MIKNKKEVKRMGKVNITIDGVKVEVEDNLTVLEAARIAGIEIPTLCFIYIWNWD